MVEADAAATNSCRTLMIAAIVFLLGIVVAVGVLLAPSLRLVRAAFEDVH